MCRCGKAGNFVKNHFKNDNMTEVKTCRFGMFVRLKPGIVGRYPNNSLTWYHRGDRYTQKENEMLCNLLKMLIKHHSKWITVELYDNERAEKFNPDRIVVKMLNGVIEINRLSIYEKYLDKVYLPEWLKF